MPVCHEIAASIHGFPLQQLHSLYAHFNSSGDGSKGEIIGRDGRSSAKQKSLKEVTLKVTLSDRQDEFSYWKEKKLDQAKT